MKSVPPLKGTAPLPSLGGLNMLERLTRLYDIVRSLNSIVQLDTLLNQIVAAAAEILDTRGGALMLLNSEGAALTFEVTSGRVASERKGTTLAVDESTLEGRTALWKRPLIDNDLWVGPSGPLLSGGLARYDSRKLLCAPLMVLSRVTGVLEVVDKVSGEDFNREDMRILEALADAAVIAIENVRRYEAEHRQAQLLAQAYTDLKNTYRATLHALTSMLDTRDVATHGHSVRVAAFTLRLARQLGITDLERLRYIEQGAMLHDVGKIGVRDNVLHKAGPLSENEWNEMREHPELGYRMLKGIEFLQPALPIVLCHHEHWDGSGYPQGLQGQRIPLEARIFAVADAFDAITSERPYAHARSYEQAVSILLEEVGSRFDPAIVKAFVSVPKADWDQIRNSISGA
ncbi:MAG: HD domain-containing protein [Chloroflexota bacterium]|nr:HD domain-containing protein [Chloroflexota bacterium]